MVLNVERLSNFSSQEGTESFGVNKMEFIFGTKKLIAGFDGVLRQLKLGDLVEVRIPPELAYGKVG